jgi:hypothetical protein
MLAILGACHGLRRRRLRRWTIYGIFSIGFCGLLSFGPLLDHVRFGALLGAPYHLLAAYYPGFRFARNLWRFGAVAQVFLATLAGLGLAVCFSGPRRPMYGAVLGTLITLATAVDVLATPIPLLDLGADPARAQWMQWLLHSPPETTLVHIPMPSGLMPEDFERTTFWMNCQMYHRRRIANGYAAYVPSRTALLIHVMPRFPDVESIRTLQYFGINHVVASSEWLTPDRANQVQQWRKWVIPELSTSDIMIYRIVGAVPQSQ